MINAGVIGWPVAHSRSPLIHGFWLKQHRIEGSYLRIPVEPGHVATFLAGLEAACLAGCNVTLPHKEAAFAQVRIADEATERLGVVNTVYRRAGVTWGTSTDGAGFLASLSATAPGWTARGQHITVLGAGGAARAIAGTMVAEGAAQVIAANRSLARADELRRVFGQTIVPCPLDEVEAVLGETSLLINTTSLGMRGQPPLALNLDRLPSSAIVADIVYTPLETALISSARQRGLIAVPGLGMLLHQAVKGFSLWFGVTPAVTPELYDLVAADILAPQTPS